MSTAGWGFISIYAAAYAGTWLAVLTPIMVTPALRARQLAPESPEYGLSLVPGVGALFALVSNPLVGWLSDRTTSRTSCSSRRSFRPSASCSQAIVPVRRAR
ncbi:MAG: hypothetical protein WDO68_28595 [Gammaproteobacteria bacterium]